jgi:hypothetical protein
MYLVSFHSGEPPPNYIITHTQLQNLKQIRIKYYSYILCRSQRRAAIKLFYTTQTVHVAALHKNKIEKILLLYMI